MKTIRTLLLLAVVWSVTLRPLSSASAVVAIAASSAPAPTPEATMEVGWTPLLFAQVSSVQRAVDDFLDLLKILTLPMVVALACFAAWRIHEGRLQDGLLALAGALILALAVTIARLLTKL